VPLFPARLRSEPILNANFPLNSRCCVCEPNSGLMSRYDELDAREQGRRARRGGTYTVVRSHWSAGRCLSNRGQLELETRLTRTKQTSPIASNRGDSQGSAGRCQRSPERRNRGQLFAVCAILIDTRCRLESALSRCKQTTEPFLIVAESRVLLRGCSPVTVPHVAYGTGAGSLAIRIKYLESDWVTGDAGKWIGSIDTVAGGRGWNRTCRSKRCRS
jgi:hypothetical protein